jgi:hypothetical protein
MPVSYVSPHKRACRHQLPNCLLPFPWDCVGVVRHPPKGQRVLREFGRFGSSWLTVGRISLCNEMTNRVHKTDLVPVFKTLASGNAVRDSSPRQSFWFWRETAVKSQALSPIESAFFSFDWNVRTWIGHEALSVRHFHLWQCFLVQFYAFVDDSIQEKDVRGD